MRPSLCTGLAVVTALSAGATASDNRQAKNAERNLKVVMSFYPDSSLKRGEQGEVKFAFDVARDGRIMGCEILSSSGYADLDKATCDVMLAGGSVGPARNESGWRIAKRHTGTLNWTLPANVTRPANPPEYTTKPKVPGIKLECHLHNKTGSLILKEKPCLTKENWARVHDDVRDWNTKIQEPKGGGGGGNEGGAGSGG